jgi:acylphosphatase
MRLHVVVRGRVQGVGFRWFVQESANSLDLAGWVRNTPDGSVEIEAEGNPAEVQRLRVLLDDGPSRARVESVEAIAVGSEQLERPFRIKR